MQLGSFRVRLKDIELLNPSLWAAGDNKPLSTGVRRGLANEQQEPAARFGIRHMVKPKVVAMGLCGLLLLLLLPWEHLCAL